MNYMLNIIVCEISPILHENVAFYMGKLQVIKDSRSREWIFSRVSLGALICNEMGILLWLLFLYVFFYDFLELLLSWFYEILWWGPPAKECFRFSKIILLRSINMLLILGGWIFIYFHLRFCVKKCDISFYVEYSNFYYEIFMLGKRGVTVITNIHLFMLCKQLSFLIKVLSFTFLLCYVLLLLLYVYDEHEWVDSSCLRIVR